MAIQALNKYIETALQQSNTPYQQADLISLVADKFYTGMLLGVAALRQFLVKENARASTGIAARMRVLGWQTHALGSVNG